MIRFCKFDNPSFIHSEHVEEFAETKLQYKYMVLCATRVGLSLDISYEQITFCERHQKSSLQKTQDLKQPFGIKWSMEERERGEYFGHGYHKLDSIYAVPPVLQFCIQLISGTMNTNR